ncbi:AI-2E family transporter [Aridibaculum aurantiacum]|uniref:AI-2E family transporter n=1 Tax=Aridibaculum aurantiacum TaxID=2810307 RepID=UPI001A976492|nr:AI-2E family transporter [Aridibaculum aurantiacum]
MKLPPLLKAVLIVVLLFGIFAGLYFAKQFLIPFTLAAVLSMLFLPVSRWLERIGANRAIAAIACILILLSVFAGLVALVSWQVNQLMEDKAKLEQQAKKAYSDLQNTIDKTFGVTPQKQEEMIQKQQQQSGGAGGKILSSISGFFIDAIIMIVYIFFFMYSRSHVKKAILQMVPQERKKKADKVITDTAHVTQQYLTGLGMMIFCLWIMYGIGFSLLGVKNALFFAILCGILEIIPFIGNVIGTTITILVTVAQGSDMTIILGIVIVYALVQFIQGNVLEPLIVGAEVNINALATIIVLVIGDQLWGIPGVVLAIPLLGITKVICDNVEPLKPIGFLIGQEKKEKSGDMMNKVKGWFKNLKPST